MKVYFDSVSDRILYVSSADSGKTPKWGSNGLIPLLLYLLQIENYIKESMKMEMAQLQQSAVHNHTAAMLEMGTNLLSQTAEQTRKLTDVETQVKHIFHYNFCELLSQILNIRSAGMLIIALLS